MKAFPLELLESRQKIEVLEGEVSRLRSQVRALKLLRQTTSALMFKMGGENATLKRRLTRSKRITAAQRKTIRKLPVWDDYCFTEDETYEAVDEITDAIAGVILK